MDGEGFFRWIERKQKTTGVCQTPDIQMYSVCTIGYLKHKFNVYMCLKKEFVKVGIDDEPRQKVSRGKQVVLRSQ